MSYFSRLTDIVTCNLSDVLAEESDPQQALSQIISEMREGLAGAQRSVNTARSSVQRIQDEINEHRRRIATWKEKAKSALKNQQEDEARLALLRKQELEDVVAGLEQQRAAATATFEHLSTMQRALEARIAEAERKRRMMESGEDAAREDDEIPTTEATGTLQSLNNERAERLENELKALRAELE